MSRATTSAVTATYQPAWHFLPAEIQRFLRVTYPLSITANPNGTATGLTSPAKDDRDQFGAIRDRVQNKQKRHVVLHTAFADP